MNSLRQGLILWSLFCFFQACGNSGQGTDIERSQQALQSCPSGVVQISMGDTMIQHLCGCQEPAGQMTGFGSVFDCTFNMGSGTQVFIHYLATRLQHQVVSLGTPIFTSSPVHDPSQSSPTLTHSFRIGTAGTYRFQDQFNAALRGQFNAL